MSHNTAAVSQQFPSRASTDFGRVQIWKQEPFHVEIWFKACMTSCLVVCGLWHRYVYTEYLLQYPELQMPRAADH